MTTWNAIESGVCRQPNSLDGFNLLAHGASEWRERRDPRVVGRQRSCPKFMVPWYPIGTPCVSWNHGFTCHIFLDAATAKIFPASCIWFEKRKRR